MVSTHEAKRSALPRITHFFSQNANFKPLIPIPPHATRNVTHQTGLG